MKAGRISVLLSGSAIVLGAMIYVLFRPGEYLLFNWINHVGPEHFIHTLRTRAHFPRLHLSDWIIYALPDGLWSFAFALMISSLWSASRSWLKYLWLAIVPLLILGFELLQYSPKIPGVCSLQDILFCSAGIAAGYYVGLTPKKPTRHERIAA